MRRALRAHFRDVLAIIGLVLAGLFAVTVILVNQRASLPDWVPLIGSDRFELEADFSSAQAVTPGQGQSVDIAGIKVGDVTAVKLEDGHAVVTMSIDNKYASLIHDDASLLLRPKTGLNDMVVEVDPGTQSTPEIKEGSTVPLASTQPQVNPDEILASLDADTQQFLKLLLANGAEALDPAKGRDVKLSNALRRLDPFARDISRITGALAARRKNIAQLDPQLPAALDRAGQPGPGPGRLRGLLERGPRPRSPSSRPRSEAPYRSCPARSRRRRAL